MSVESEYQCSLPQFSAQSSVFSGQCSDYLFWGIVFEVRADGGATPLDEEWVIAALAKLHGQIAQPVTCTQSLSSFHVM